MTERYRDFDIHYEPPPIPDRRWDWHYVHVEYCGDGDDRCGDASSLVEAKGMIDLWHEEQAEDFNHDIGE
ncbi:hypothetical protein [Phyllobacterium sp. P5_D12]